MKNKKHNRIAFVIVAILLVALTTTSATYAWIDDVKQVEFDNTNVADNGAPLKTGVDINSTVKITKNTNEINLGNMLTNDDLTYTDGESSKRHTKYDGNNNDGNNNARKPDWDYINDNKGYFYESGGMHLSPCYSDGETFYFPRQGTDGYREGNKDDENVNYISYTMQVSSPDANVDFWFRNEPSIATKGTTNKLTSHARYAITVDGQSHVYSATGTANTCNAGLTGTMNVDGVRKTSTYTYNHADNTTDSRGKNSNTLFSIKKGDTVNLNVKIWLEPGFNTNNTAVDINFQLVSSWAYTRTIKIVDKTTGPQGTSWIGDNSAKLFLVLPQFLEELDSDPAHWYNLRDKAPIYALTAGSTAGTYSVSLPLVYNNEEMMVYRCNDIGWNDSGSDASARSSYNVHCWNWWGTYTPNTYKEESYTLYGSSLDESANNCFKFSVDSNNNPLPKAQLTNKGYGTWGGVELIDVYSHYSNTDYVPKRDSDNNIQKLFVRDYSDYDTSGEVYIYEMSRLSSVDVNHDGKIDADDDSGITEDDSWKTYVPKSSSRLQFDAFTSGNSRFGVWGYQSWNKENPQRRPLASTGLYENNATVYHIARNYGGDQGWGYWNGAEGVYLIKAGFLWDSDDLYAHLFESGTVFLKTNDNWRRDNARITVHFWNNNGGDSGWSEMTKVSDDTYFFVTPSGNWTNVMFARRNPNNWNEIWTQTSDLPYYDGRVYDVSSNSWDYYQKSTFPGDKKLTQQTDSSGNPVKKQYANYSSDVYKYDDVRVYRNVIFSNGSNSNQSLDLTLFPGCFYEPDTSNSNAGKWYGALNENGREATVDTGGSSGGDETGGDTIPGYTIDSGFVFKINNNNYTVYQNAAGTEFKVRIPLAAGANLTTVQKSGKGVYGLEEASQSYDVPRSTVNLFLTNAHRNNFSFNASSAGNYIATFTYDNGNTGTIKISSVLKES